MSDYALTPMARSDLFGIWNYIAKDSEDAANRVERSIFEACAFVARNPLCGHTRRDLTPREVRFWTVPAFPNYSLA